MRVYILLDFETRRALGARRPMTQAREVLLCQLHAHSRQAAAARRVQAEQRISPAAQHPGHHHPPWSCEGLTLPPGEALGPMAQRLRHLDATLRQQVELKVTLNQHPHTIQLA